jgi:hypothetical protein
MGRLIGGGIVVVCDGIARNGWGRRSGISAFSLYLLF